jgi:hypothetical protein
VLVPPELEVLPPLLDDAEAAEASEAVDAALPASIELPPDELEEQAAARVKSIEDPRLRRIPWLRMVFTLRSGPEPDHVQRG